MADTSSPWFRDPDMIRALLGAGGAGISAYAGNKQASADREQNQRQSRAATLSNLYGAAQDQDFQREQLGLQSTQMNPYTQLEDAQRQAIRAALLSDISNVTGHYNPGTGQGGLSGGINLANLRRPDVQNFYSPDARLAAQKQFDYARAAASPNVPIGVDASGNPMGNYAGYGQAGAQAAGDISRFGAQRFADLQQRRDTEREAIMRALDEDLKGEKKKGGGFWSKLGKIGLIAGGGIATAMTGGAAAPLLGAAIGAGSGALSGGGLKGALLGGALGGLTGGFGGGAGSTIKEGFGDALKSTFTNPNTLMRMGGAGVGGPVGGALDFAGQLGLASKIPGMPQPQPAVPKIPVNYANPNLRYGNGR